MGYHMSFTCSLHLLHKHILYKYSGYTVVMMSLMTHLHIRAAPPPAANNVTASNTAPHLAISAPDGRQLAWEEPEEVLDACVDPKKGREALEKPSKNGLGARRRAGSAPGAA